MNKETKGILIDVISEAIMNKPELVIEHLLKNNPNLTNKLTDKVTKMIEDLDYNDFDLSVGYDDRLWSLGKQLRLSYKGKEFKTLIIDSTDVREGIVSKLNSEEAGLHIWEKLKKLLQSKD